MVTLHYKGTCIIEKLQIMKSKLTSREYLTPLVLITTLFFLWGFARAILDVLNKHFQETLDVSITESSLIQVTTYMGYFLMAIPAGMFIRKQGYKRGVLLGLSLFALGAFLFVPGSDIGTLPVFLVCLFILACGLAILETAANPYATELGPRATSSSRLNLCQSFNGLGSCLAPWLVGGFLFSGSGDTDVSFPYIIMGIVVVLIAIVFSFSKLPEIKTDAVSSTSESDESHPLKSLFKNKMFLLGAFALLCYEISEISINSYFVNYTTGVGMLSKSNASFILSLALMFFMIGRFLGAWIMQKVSAEKVLYYCAIGTVLSQLLLIISSLTLSSETSWACYIPLVFLLFTYVFEAIMFPTIFSLSIQGLGGLTKTASSILMMTPVGGCAFLLVGLMADNFGFVIPFVIPLLGFVVVLIYSYRKLTSLNNHTI